MSSFTSDFYEVLLTMFFWIIYGKFKVKILLCWSSVESITIN